MPGPRLKKIISGMQSGGDLFGLEAAQKLGIPTGGYGAGASGAVTKDSSGRNIEAPELRDKFGIAPVPPEIQQQFEQRYGKATGARGLWLPRTYANVSSSDATVYFITKDNSAGLAATKRYADDLGKPFLIVDERKPEDMKKLADFSAANNIEVLNIAGNRELSNPAFVEQAISGAFGPSDLTSNLPMDPEQLIRNQQAAEMGKKLFGYQEPGIGRYPSTFKADPRYSQAPPVPMSPQERAIREAMKGSALSGKEFYGGYPNKQALIEGIKAAASQGVDVAELLPLIPAGVLSPEDHADLMKSRWQENPRTGGLTSKAIDPGIEHAIEAVGAPGIPTEYGNQLPFGSYGVSNPEAIPATIMDALDPGQHQFMEHSLGLTPHSGRPGDVPAGKKTNILSASQLKRIGGMDSLEKQLEALRDIVYDRGIQAHNEIKQNVLNYMENTAGTPAGTKTIAGKIRDAQAGGKFSGATSEDLVNQMATGIADQSLTGVSQRAGKYEPAVVEGTTTFEDPDKVLMRALVNSDIPFEQDPDAASASEGYKVDTEAAFIENMGDKKRFDPTVNTRPIEQLSPGERLAATLQGATGIPPLSESEIMKLVGEINRVKTATVQSFADQPELLLGQGRQQQMVWNPKTDKHETTIDYTGKEKSAHSPLDYLYMWNKGARGKVDIPDDVLKNAFKQTIKIPAGSGSAYEWPQADVIRTLIGDYNRGFEALQQNPELAINTKQPEIVNPEVPLDTTYDRIFGPHGERWTGKPFGVQPREYAAGYGHDDFLNARDYVDYRMQKPLTGKLNWMHLQPRLDLQTEEGGSWDIIPETEGLRAKTEQAQADSFNEFVEKWNARHDVSPQEAELRSVLRLLAGQDKYKIDDDALAMAMDYLADMTPGNRSEGKDWFVVTLEDDALSEDEYDREPIWADIAHAEGEVLEGMAERHPELKKFYNADGELDYKGLAQAIRNAPGSSLDMKISNLTGAQGNFAGHVSDRIPHDYAWRNVPRYDEAVELTKGKTDIGTADLQRALGIGFGQASALMRKMEEAGVVQALEGQSKRRVVQMQSTPEGMIRNLSPARPQSILPMDTGFPLDAGAVLGEQAGPRINPMFRYTPEDFGANVPMTPEEIAAKEARNQELRDAFSSTNDAFDLEAASPEAAAPEEVNKSLRDRMASGAKAVVTAPIEGVKKTGGKIKGAWDSMWDSNPELKGPPSRMSELLTRRTNVGSSLNKLQTAIDDFSKTKAGRPIAWGKAGIEKAASFKPTAGGLISLGGDLFELSKGAITAKEYAKYGTPKDLVLGRDVADYNQLILHLAGNNTDGPDGVKVQYITPEQGQRLFDLRDELVAGVQSGQYSSVESHPNYKTMRRNLNEYTKMREGGPEGAFGRSINVLEKSSKEDMGWMPQYRLETQAGTDSYIDEPESDLTPYGMFHMPGWSDYTGQAASVEGAGEMASGTVKSLMNPLMGVHYGIEGVFGNVGDYDTLGSGFVRSPNYQTLRLRSDVDSKKFIGKNTPEKIKEIYDATPYSNRRYWKWNPDSRTLTNKHTGTAVREEDTGIENFGEKWKNWGDYVQALRDVRSVDDNKHAVTDHKAIVDKNFKDKPMFTERDHGNYIKPEPFKGATAWDALSMPNVPWYAKLQQFVDRGLTSMKPSNPFEGVADTGQLDEVADPYQKGNVIRIYNQTGDNPGEIVGYNRSMGNDSFWESPVSNVLTEHERMIKSLTPYWEHKESKYTDIYKLIGEDE
tara:strand:- start:5737 stop:10926 length:5190 start_codon:yes stop_codon:yes gene_type:complete